MAFVAEPDPDQRRELAQPPLGLLSDGSKPSHQSLAPGGTNPVRQSVLVALVGLLVVLGTGYCSNRRRTYPVGYLGSSSMTRRS